MPRDVTATPVSINPMGRHSLTSGAHSSSTPHQAVDGLATVSNTGLASSMQADKQVCAQDVGNGPLAGASLPLTESPAGVHGALPASAEPALTAEEVLNRSLREAAALGHVEGLAASIAAGASLNATNKSGSTALMIAAQRGKLEAVKMLGAAGADIHATNKKGESAISLAVAQGHAHVVKELRLQGARLSYLQLEMNTPALKRFIDAGNWPVSAALIAAGVNTFAAFGQGLVTQLSPMVLRGLLGANDVARAAMRCSLASTGALQVDLDCAMACVAAMKYPELTKALHAMGARMPDSCKAGAERGLRDMVRTNDRAGVQAWLEAGVSVNAVNQDGVSALMYVTQVPSLDLLELLINAGADPELFDKDGETALIYAAKRGNQGAADMLLRHGVDAGLNGPGSPSALQWALTLNHLGVANRLLESGAQCTPQDLLNAVRSLTAGLPDAQISPRDLLQMATLRALHAGLVHLAAVIPTDVEAVQTYSMI
ncbi:ankyrin repeat domain-containing protein [Ottowia thiooxydans]|uniref:Ankyrin repeat protein n=1 Tax=Ottowia thiooxydans TaxID=219182 RepID=A0ABV2QGF8_9BURK